jgi:hypothetical protein
LSEGGYQLNGLQQAIGIPVTTPINLPVAGTFYPIVSIRLKTSPDRLDAIVIATAISIIATTVGDYNWQVIASGTTSGGSWLPAPGGSSVDYNITGTSFSTGTGRILASGYFSVSNQGSTQVDILKEALFKTQLERDSFTSTPYELTVVVATNNANGDVLASMDWEEISR